ncbi:MAG: metallophosphoesterase, partial [Bacteroidota bacterium]
FLGMLYGITKGKYRYTVNKVKLNFPDLPKAFDGFKIVQISDIHSGSFDDVDKVAEGVAMVNEQAADLLLFTGDLVNSDKDEINPYIDIFKKLEAKEGKYAVLGNHDYYGAPKNDSELDAYWKDFFSKYEQMGFRLMNNENTRIERDGEQIRLLGVENWGAPPFPQIGDLDKALNNVQEDEFCVLMSHDPTHWEHRVLPNKKKIHLTLSGHTHGMQFGINLPGLKWSPVQYRYKRWIGLYEEAKQYLYINRGFGFLAFPGRVGMWPEITVIELGVA